MKSSLFSKMNILHKSLGAYLIVLLILLALGGLFFQSYRKEMQATEKRMATFQTISVVNRVLSDLQNFESDQHGYLLTGDPYYLKAQQNVSQKMSREIIRLRWLLRSDPRQLNRLNQVHTLSESKLKELAAIIRLAQTRHRAEAMLLMKTGKGKALLDDLNSVIGAIRLEEERKLPVSDNAIKRWMQLSLLIGGVFAFCVSAILTLLFYNLYREIQGRDAAQHSLHLSLERERISRRLIHLISQSFDSSFILETLVRELGDLMHADRCIVVCYDERNNRGRAEQQQQVHIGAQYCRPGIIPVKGEEAHWTQVVLFRDAISPDHPLILYNGSGIGDFPDEIKRYFESYGIHAMFAGEIHYRNNTFGRLVLHRCGTSQHWSDEDLVFLETIMTQIGVLLYQATLYQHELTARLSAERANREKTRILSFVSHDFKNPLNAMQWMLDRIKKRREDWDKMTCEQRETFSYLEMGINQLRMMVTGILDKARLEAGQLELTPQAVDIPRMMTEIEHIMKPLAEQKEVTYDWGADSSIAEIVADPAYLRQILLNLISNAIKFNRKGGSVLVTVMPDPSNAYAEFKVTDTGIGIPPEKMQKLFEEYYRVDMNQAEKVEGTGLGLAFIKKLVELHGGSISVQSPEGQGSTFTVSLPLHPALSTAQPSLKAGSRINQV